MLRKGTILAAVCILSALAPALVRADARGPWELSLSGSGENGNKFNGFTAGANASLGYFIGDALELSVRQSVSYTDIGARSILASTRGAIDLHFPLGDQNQFLPYVGANIGYDYGDQTGHAEAAPEAGIKVFVNSTTFIFASVEYQFFFNSPKGASNGFKNGEFIYGLGVGFRF